MDARGESVLVIETQELFTSARAAQVLSVSVDRVRQLQREGVLEAVPVSDTRTGRSVYTSEAVRALAKRRGRSARRSE